MKILSLTTLRELLRLSLPMVVSQGSFAVMIFTDRWFMSRIDAVHIAASLGGGVAAFFCFSLFIGVLTYANALVAQYYGAGVRAKCPQVVTQGVILAIACLPLLAILGYLGGRAFSHIGHDPAQVPLERLYFHILMAGSFFTLVKACLASYFSGIGRTRVVMVADVLGVMLNIPLSWLLIFGKGGLPVMGIAGAGLGTVVANVFAIGLFLLFYLAPFLILIMMFFVAGAVGGFFGGIGVRTSYPPAIAVLVMVVAVIGIYVLLGLIALAYYSAFLREGIGSLRLAGLKFDFEANTDDWLKLFFGDVLLVVCTLGIGLIFLQYRHWKFFITHMEAYGEIDLDELTQSTTTLSKHGEGLLDALDVGAF